MTRLTRRHFGIAALSAPALLSAKTAPARAEAASGRAPALFDAPLGRYRITALLDGMGPLHKGMFMGDGAAIDAALAAGGIAGDAMPAPVTAFLLQSEDQTILIDSGLGDVDILGPGLGRVPAALDALGVDPADVTLIIVTHAHPDHIGGMIRNGAATFPEAEVVITNEEYAFWGDAGMMARAPAEAQGLFQLAQSVYAAYGDRLRPVASGTEVAPGITMELSPGHTPGHALVQIDGGDRQLWMVADSLHNSVLHTALPDVGFGFDTDPAEAAVSRRRVFDRAVADNLIVAATHVPFPGLGQFVRAGDAYAYVPASWM
ncbi:MAG: MBL fold metallo-hydrolase [Pseudomonadota bacterium]